ncbi:hypothetical protein ACLBOM_36460 [Escherichia coli]
MAQQRLRGNSDSFLPPMGAQVASSSVLQGIISEWGELETYEGWTNLKNNWLYSSTTVISGNGVKNTIAYYFPGGQAKVS